MNLYLDTSALIKLLVDEPGSDLVKRAADGSDSVTTSRLTYVEAFSALARLRSRGLLDDLAHRACVKSFRSLWSRTGSVEPDQSVIEDAASLCTKHLLRAYDAIQLASARVVSKKEPVLFASWDRTLLAAALAEGLEPLER